MGQMYEFIYFNELLEETVISPRQCYNLLHDPPDELFCSYDRCIYSSRQEGEEQILIYNRIR